MKIIQIIGFIFGMVFCIAWCVFTVSTFVSVTCSNHQVFTKECFLEGMTKLFHFIVWSGFIYFCGYQTKVLNDIK